MLNDRICYEKHDIQIINKYAPNIPSERYDFFGGLNDLSQDTGLPIILAGEFNMVENVTLDTQDSNNANYHTTGTVQLENFKKLYNLTDGWRTKHKDKRAYTWTNKKVKCRLDIIYCRHEDVKKATSTDILTNTFSDHDFMTTTLHFKTVRRGPGYWKLNCSLIEIVDVKPKHQNSYSRPARKEIHLLIHSELVR